jgi:L-alanine-DL-glutamate epimerase-like enolase superfamily enzyme
LKITEVRFFRLTGRRSDSTDGPVAFNVVPSDLYPDLHHARHTSDRQRTEITAIYLEIETDDGTTGLYGPIQDYQAYLIATRMKHLLLGGNPLATEAHFDRMVRTDRHGRSGMFMAAVSAVDLALWDLRGKSAEMPVWGLLGGPTRLRVPTYASMLGHSVEPPAAGAKAAEVKAMGYTAQKWFFQHGPGQGTAGLEENLTMARSIREAVGPRYRLMFDTFMSWDAAYAREMLRELEEVGPYWMEEPYPPERVGAFADLRHSTSVPLATGEHVFTRWQVRELLAAGAVDFIQTDPDWTGGISEQVRICALCSSFEVPVVAHGHSLLPALHIAAAQSPSTVPYVEYLLHHQKNMQFFHSPTYVPKDGDLALPDLPGLGIVIDESRVEAREEMVFGR